MIFADVRLARRVEAAEAANARGCSLRDGGDVLEIAGGCAIFMGVDSPLTQTLGIGLDGLVNVREVRLLESFFRSRGGKVSIDLCPLADPGLLTILADRGYRPVEFNNVLFRRLSGAAAIPGPRVRVALADEADLWSRTVGRGYFDQADLSESEMDVGRAIFAMPGALCYLAIAGEGEPAGGAAAAIHSGLATLFADSTIAAFRRTGLHQELIAARIGDAIARGCDSATAATLPGSPSQRNYERMGFEVIYTRVTLVA